QRKRSEDVLTLVRDPERRPARRHHAKLSAALEKPGDLRRCGHDLFEVVEQEQRLLVSEERDKAVEQRPPLGLLDVERIGQSWNELGGIRDVGEGNERDGAEEVRSKPSAEFENDTRLSHAAWACDRDDAMRTTQLDDRIEVFSAAHEGRTRL